MFLKKAIITGATGFLGFVLLKELIQNEIYVYVLCRKNSSRISRLNGLSNVEVLEVDLNCPDKINKIDGCDVFYHLAWEGEHNDFDGQYKNVEMSLNCLKLASRLGCKRFICTGSQAEYGNKTELITEETPLKPTTAYSACKVATYYLTADLAKRLNVEHTWVRVFSVYGPNDNPNTLIMTLIRDLTTKGEASINTDGEHIWNYLYEEDAARALRMLGWNFKTDMVYNLASENNKPLKIFVENVRNAVSINSVVNYGLEKSRVNLFVTTNKLRYDIGEFEYNGFSDGIKKNLNRMESKL